MEKSVKYFENLVSLTPRPRLPDVGPRPDRKDFDDDSAYQSFLIDWELRAIEAGKELKASRYHYSVRMREIEQEFLDWSVQDNGLSALPDFVKDKVKKYALREGYDGGFRKIDYMVSCIACIALEAYRAGRNDEKREHVTLESRVD